MEKDERIALISNLILQELMTIGADVNGDVRLERMAKAISVDLEDAASTGDYAALGEIQAQAKAHAEIQRIELEDVEWEAFFRVIAVVLQSVAIGLGIVT